jgi:hypothetical protein
MVTFFHYLIFPRLAPKAILFLLFSVVFEASGQNSLVSVGIGAGIGHFTAIEAPVPSGVYGGSIKWTVSPKMGLEISGSFGSLDHGYDTPSGWNSYTITAWSAQVAMEYRTIPISESWIVSTLAGAGLNRLARPETVVSLGALGNHVLAEEIKTDPYLLAGVRVEKNLVAAVSLNLTPEMKWIDPFSSNRLWYALTGGIAIAIL